MKRGGSFYLCGPTWPADDVRKALLSAFEEEVGMSPAEAEKYLDDMKEEGRYVLEVY